jgi:hypothetical protein
MKTKKSAEKIQSPLRLGEKVFIRSVTHYYTGRIVLLTKDEIVLSDAAWIADTGRFATSLGTGMFNEVEPFAGPVSIGRGGVIDVTGWPHALPKEQK